MNKYKEDITKALIHAKFIELFGLMTAAKMRLEIGEFLGIIKCNRTHEVLAKLYCDEIVWEKDIDTDMSELFGTMRG